MTIYDKLKKIRRPVLIEVVFNRSPEYHDRYIRYRILYPDGRCEWSSSDFLSNGPDVSYCESCLSRDSLTETIRAMKNHDKSFFKIERFYPI